jgi:hypothetical protein
MSQGASIDTVTVKHIRVGSTVINIQSLPQIEPKGFRLESTYQKHFT